MSAKNKSHLLIDESPLIVLPTLAKQVGLNEAIVLQQVHWWVGINKKAGKEQVFQDGEWWAFGTYEEWQSKNFPFWSVSTVKRAFLSLQKAGLLITNNFNKSSIDRTKWYRIDYTKLNHPSGQDDPMEEVKLDSSNNKENQEKRIEEVEEVISSTKLEPVVATESTKASSASAEDKARIFKAYESNIGIITPHIRDEILAALDDGIPADWIVEAFQQAAEYNKRSWAYAKTIFRRWQTEGRDAPKPAKPAEPTPASHKPYVPPPPMEVKSTPEEVRAIVQAAREKMAKARRPDATD